MKLCEEEMKKVVLAYSGGLDTSFCVKYLSEELGYEVYTALANTGGFSAEELASVEARAYALGAKKHVNLDITGDYYDKCIKYMVFGNVLRNKTYPIRGSAGECQADEQAGVAWLSWRLTSR